MRLSGNSSCRRLRSSPYFLYTNLINAGNDMGWSEFFINKYKCRNSMPGKVRIGWSEIHRPWINICINCWARKVDTSQPCSPHTSINACNVRKLMLIYKIYAQVSISSFVNDCLKYRLAKYELIDPTLISNQSGNPCTEARDEKSELVATNEFLCTGSHK